MVDIDAYIVRQINRGQGLLFRTNTKPGVAELLKWIPALCNAATQTGSDYVRVETGRLGVTGCLKSPVKRISNSSPGN